MHPKGQVAPHGTTSRYTRHKCRCEECREAMRAYKAEWRARRRGEGMAATPRTASEHGTRSRYQRCSAGPGGSKCEPCREANRKYQRVYMQDHRAGVKWGKWEDPAFAGW